jgi:hypothetical protein
MYKNVEKNGLKNNNKNRDAILTEDKEKLITKVLKDNLH